LLLTRVVLAVEDRELAADEVVRRERAALGPMRPAERRMAALFAAAAALWITRVDLDLGAFVVPGWEPLVRRLAGTAAGGEHLTDASVALALAVLGFLVPSGDRERPRLFHWDLARGMPWDVLLLIGSGFCIADGIRSTGLDRVIGAALAGWMDGASEPAAVLVVVLAVAGVSELASNTATAQVFLPVLGATAAAAGLDPRAVLLPATAAASCGFMLPAGTPPNALVYATRLVPAPLMARVGLAVDLATALLVWGVFELWGRRVIGIGAAGAVLPDWAR
jgi:sodium-dependent dicarboxylate transporter 2/3/5